MLVDTGVTINSLHRGSLARSFDLRLAGYDRHGVDQLDLHIVQFDLGKHQPVGADMLELLRLCIYLSRHRDADEIIGEHPVHRRNVSGKLSDPPLLFQSLHLLFGIMPVLMFLVRLGAGARKKARQ